MANITTDNLKAIVQSVIASATRHKPNLSVTDPDDPRFVVGAEEVAKQADVTKMGKRLTTLEQYEDETNQIANSASSKATTANNTANNALSTANTAKSTAESAKSTATAANDTANTALSTANTAKITATTANNTANTALSTANSAAVIADGALPKSGGTILGDVHFAGGYGTLNSSGKVICTTLDVRTDRSTVFGTLRFEPKKNAESECWVGRDSETDANAPSTMRFRANGAKKMVLKGMNILRMQSDNKSFWDLYVDDEGQLLVTDAAGKEIKQNATMTLTAPGGGKYRLTVDDEGNLTTEVVE